MERAEAETGNVKSTKTVQHVQHILHRELIHLVTLSLTILI